MREFDSIRFHRAFRHDMADVNGVRLHYVIGGQGSPVMLLHGWPMTWYAWRHVMPILAERHTVIAPDLRGLGNSSKPANGYDKLTASEDIRLLALKLGFETVSLVGHDIGGLVAYPYAAANPGAVRHLAIIETTLMGFGREVGLEAKLDNADGLRLWHMPFHMAPGMAEMLVAGRERAYLAAFFDRSLFQPNAFSEADLDVYERAYSAPGGLGMGYYRTFYKDAEDNRALRGRKLEIPALGVGGAGSQGDGPYRCLREAAHDARCLVVERCGHYVPEEQPEELASALLAFFDGTL